MTKSLLFILLISFITSTTIEGFCNSSVSAINTEEEYEKYKREGDEFFKKGDYEKALKKFKVCLEVPGFSDDAYSLLKIILSEECLILKKQADILFQKEDGVQGVALLKLILNKNPEDIETKKTLTNYWISNGNKNYGFEKFFDAQSSYTEALNYAEDKTTLTILIQNCIDKTKTQKDTSEAQTPQIKDKTTIAPNYTNAPSIKRLTNGVLIKDTDVWDDFNIVKSKYLLSLPKLTKIDFLSSHTLNNMTFYQIQLIDGKIGYINSKNVTLYNQNDNSSIVQKTTNDPFIKNKPKGYLTAETSVWDDFDITKSKYLFALPKFTKIDYSSKHLANDRIYYQVLFTNGKIGYINSINVTLY